MKSMMLLVACLVIASAASAVPVNPSAPDGVAAVWLNDAWAWILCTDGQVYRMHSVDQQWTLMEDHLPVVVASIADWSPYFILSTSGDLWRGESALNNEDWTLAPTIPCIGAVQSQGNSLGAFKSLFR